MPFGWVSPSIGLGLLSAQLKREGIECEVHYPNLLYAARVGFDLYQRISHIAPPESLLGEWIFAPCVFEDSGDEAAYLELYRRRFSDRLAPVDSAALAGEVQALRRESAGFLDEACAAIDWRNYDVVGFTSSFHQTLASVALARLIKERAPWVRTVMGGANCEGPMGLALHRAFPQIDFICGGEADISFPQLVRALMDSEASGSGIPGVISRTNGESHYTDLTPERIRDLDALPFPDYDSYFAELAALPALPRTRHLLMETSRGCWWGARQQCTFCGLNGLAMPFRSKSAPRALDEIETLSTRYDTKKIEMVDNILDMRYFQTLLPELVRRDLGLDLFYETKANLKREQVKLLAEAGVRRIQPGIESFSTRVLGLMKKGSTAAQNLQLLKWCKEYGVQCDWNLLYGFPGETAEDYAELPALLAQLHDLDSPVSAGAIRMDRFSPYFESPAEYGLTGVRPDAFYPLVFAVPDAHLADLAYYFEFDYPAGHDHQAYAARLQMSIKSWRSSAARESISPQLAGKLAALGASATTGERRVLETFLGGAGIPKEIAERGKAAALQQLPIDNPEPETYKDRIR